MNTLKIKDRVFEIKEALLIEREDENKRKRWSVDINTVMQEFDGQEWKPRIRGENVSVDSPGLDNIEGHTIRIKRAHDERTEERRLMMYVFGYEDVYNSDITFVTKTNSMALVKWTGLCNIFVDEEYGEGVPFEMYTEIDLKKEYE